MQIPPRFSSSNKIIRLIAQIDELIASCRGIDQVEPILTYHRRASILKSSLFSARIEGNPLSPGILSKFHNLTPSKAKKELENLVQSLEIVQKQNWESPLELAIIKNLHNKVMKDLIAEAGQLRHESLAIYNMAGIAVYLAPPSGELKVLLSDWLAYINSSQGVHPLIKTAIAHYVFEKIHPFMDGNGRVGRVLMHVLLKKYGYDMLGLCSFEEYLDKNRDDYYNLLGRESSDVTDFVEFILESYVYGLQAGLASATTSIPTTSGLMPRRQEILSLVIDHPLSSFDFIHRRFMAVPARTLRFDIKFLCDHGHLQKLGTTRGVVYSQA